MAGKPRQQIFDITNDENHKGTTVTIPPTETPAHPPMDLDGFFDDPSVGTADDIPLGEMPPTQNLSDILNVALNQENLTADYAGLFFPSGDYAWVGPRVLNVSYNTKDRERWDVSSEGRMFINISGKLESKDGLESVPFYKLSLSPDKRLRKDVMGKLTKDPDLLYKNFLITNQFYFDTVGGNPETLAKVVSFLMESPYYMYIARGKSGGNYFNAFKRFE